MTDLEFKLDEIYKSIDLDKVSAETVALFSIAIQLNKIADSLSTISSSLDTVGEIMEEK